MAWIEVDEPFAAPPRGSGVLAAPDGEGVVDLDDRWGTISGATLHGPVDARACERLEIEASVLRGVEIAAGPDLEIHVRACEIADSDLSGLRFTTMSGARVTGCKLSGADLTTATVRDTILDRCLLRTTSWRMAEIERVQFADCSLEDVDLYAAALADVSFDGSRLRAIEADQTRFHHVDLRGAHELDLRACSRLAGCLVTAEQVLELAYVLARVAGVTVQRPPDMLQT